MGGKYEIRYYSDDVQYITDYTNSWLRFIRLRLTKKIIYFKVYSEQKRRDKINYDKF